MKIINTHVAADGLDACVPAGERVAVALEDQKPLCEGDDEQRQWGGKKSANDDKCAQIDGNK